MCILNLYAILGMLALILLLDNIDTLVQFAQSQDIFVCNYIAALKICEGQFYAHYIDSTTIFEFEEFWAFKDIQNFIHDAIHLK